jgi:Protein of unknown function (DUF3093)
VPVPEQVPDPQSRYREQLRVPLRWWVQGTMLVATFWLAFVVSMPATWAWTATLVLLLIMVGLFVGYGSPPVEVADGWLRAGRARISGEHIGLVLALDADETRRTAGVQADARAYLLLRPYLKNAVKVQIADPADPAPYWLLSSRDPEALAASLRGIARGSASPSGGPNPGYDAG